MRVLLLLSVMGAIWALKSSEVFADDPIPPQPTWSDIDTAAGGEKTYTITITRNSGGSPPGSVELTKVKRKKPGQDAKVLERPDEYTYTQVTNGSKVIITITLADGLVAGDTLSASGTATCACTQRCPVNSCIVAPD